MRKYLLVYPNRDYGRLMWRDLEKLDNVDFINKPLFVNNVLIDLLFRIHFSFKIEYENRIAIKTIWRNIFFRSYDFDQSNEYVILFTDPSLCNYRK